METIIATVFLLAALAVLPAFAASIYSCNLLNRYLQQEHPDVWTKIGPDSLAEPSLSAPVTRFVTQRTYRQVGDARLTVLGDRCFRLLYMTAAIFLVLVLSGLMYGVLKA